MRYSKELIKAVCAKKWEGVDNRKIARWANKKFYAGRNMLNENSVESITSKYTLRHHGEPVARKDWPPKENENQDHKPAGA